MQPLISIITPYYQAKSTIEFTISSVQQQTYRNWELIVVNDDLDEHVQELIAQNYSKDGRIKYLKNCNKKGAAGARNTGIEAASGKYIAFLDSDDLWSPDKLARQLKFMMENDVAFSYGNYFSFKSLASSGKPITTGNFTAPSILSFEELCKTCSIGCLTVMIDKEKAPLLEMPYTPKEDYACWLLLTKGGLKAYNYGGHDSYYRIGQHSLSANKFKELCRQFVVVRRVAGLSMWRTFGCLAAYVLNGLRKHKSYRAN